MERREMPVPAPTKGEKNKKHINGSNLLTTSIDSHHGDVRNVGAFAVQVARPSDALRNMGSSERSWDPTQQAPSILAPDVESDNFRDELAMSMSNQQQRERPVAMEANVRLVSSEHDKKQWVQRWHIVIAVTLFAATAAVGGGIGAFFAGSASGDDRASGDEANAPTMEPADKCNFNNVSYPSPLLQCSCLSKINMTSPTTTSLYGELKSQLLSDYVGPDDDCHPENIALWWAVTERANSHVDNVFDATSAEAEFSAQRYALALLYLSVSDWQSEDSSAWLGAGSECDWRGISCNSLLRVSGIDMSNHGLEGELPPTVFAFLPFLNSIVMSGNKLYQRIPSEVWTLVDLQVLDLSYNSLSGSIPDDIVTLKELTSLKLNNNRFTGRIPPGLYTSLGDLSKLDFSSASMTGTISDDIGFLTNLEAVAFAGNEFKGSLPTTLGFLTSITSLIVAGNYFTGTLPTELALLSNLETMDASLNVFTGPLPTELGSLTELTFLRLSTNKLTGTIPESLGKLSKLETLMLSASHLTSAIPAFEQDLNAFTGSVPNGLCGVEKLSVPCSVKCDCCTWSGRTKCS
jgi:Leucine-rich repeat (LRR) protein